MIYWNGFDLWTVNILQMIRSCLIPTTTIVSINSHCELNEWFIPTQYVRTAVQITEIGSNNLFTIVSSSRLRHRMLLWCVVRRIICENKLISYQFKLSSINERCHIIRPYIYGSHQLVDRRRLIRFILRWHISFPSEEQKENYAET